MFIKTFIMFFTNSKPDLELLFLHSEKVSKQIYRAIVAMIV